MEQHVGTTLLNWIGKDNRETKQSRNKVRRSREDAFEGQETSGHFGRENSDCGRKP